jgi:7,8-dihydropterin-6-yl-methyl-4-(beta-D-ribofuranosyl)aminobenzene 5'-phosphate synthase
METNDRVNRLRITVLTEDYAGYDSPLFGSHGISLLLEIYGSDYQKNILFDVAQSSEAILYNMRILGISPRCVDLIFLSHCHFDHTGGLLGMVKAIEKTDLPIVGHPTLFRPHYVLEPNIRHIGVPRESHPEELGKQAQLVLLGSSFSLMPGVISTGEVKREVPFEKTPTVKTFTEEHGTLVRDDIQDDLSLAIKIAKMGLVVVTGCSHAGIVNIVQQAIRLTGERKIRAVIGGLHLIDADEDRIHKTAEALTDLGVETLYVGHCTGLKGEAILLQQFKDRLCKLHSGMRIDL